MEGCSIVYSFNEVSAEEFFFSGSFLFLLGQSFLIFSFIFAGLMIFISNIFKYLLFPFSPVVLMHSWFGSYIPFTFLIFLLSTWHNFSQQIFNLVSCLYILRICYDDSRSFYLFSENPFISSIHITVNIFLWFCKFFPPLTFPKYAVWWYHI